MRRPKKCIVEVVENELLLRVGGASASLLLDSITKVTALKVDNFIFDTVWVEVESPERTMSFSEECEGFAAAMAFMDARLPRFFSKWREVVVLPAFAENRTALFMRLANRLILVAVQSKFM